MAYALYDAKKTALLPKMFGKNLCSKAFFVFRMIKILRMLTKHEFSQGWHGQTPFVRVHLKGVAGGVLWHVE